MISTQNLFSVTLPLAYEQLRPELKYHSLWLKENLYVRLPYGYEDPKTYFYHDETIDQPDLVTQSSSRVYYHSTTNSFHDQTILNNVVDHLQNRTVQKRLPVLRRPPLTHYLHRKRPQLKNKVVKKTKNSLFDYLVKTAATTALEELDINNQEIKSELIDLIVKAVANLKHYTKVPDITSILPKILSYVKGSSDPEKLREDLEDLSVAGSEISEVTDGPGSTRYLFLLGIVPAIAGSLIAAGIAPLQVLLIAAYVVTSYLFLVENRFGRRLDRSGVNPEHLELETSIRSLFNKSLDLLEKTNVTEATAGVETKGNFTMNDFYKDNQVILPLLNLLDDKSRVYIQNFDALVMNIMNREA